MNIMLLYAVEKSNNWEQSNGWIIIHSGGAVLYLSLRTFFPVCLSTMAPSLSLPGLAMAWHLTSCDSYSRVGSSCTWRHTNAHTQKTTTTAAVRRAQTPTYQQSKGTICRGWKATGQKSFANQRLSDCRQVCAWETTQEVHRWAKENYTGLLHQLCSQNVGWVNGSVVWDFCWNFHSTLWDILLQWDRKHAHEVVWIRALGTLKRFIKEPKFLCL